MFILCESITYIHACWTTKYIQCCHCIVTFIKERRTNTYARTLIHTFRSFEKSSTFFSVACVCVRLCLCVVVVVVVFFISLCYLALISNSFNFRLCATAAAALVVVFPIFFFKFPCSYLSHYLLGCCCVRVCTSSAEPNEIKPNREPSQNEMFTCIMIGRCSYFCRWCCCCFWSIS